ncbi:MAG: DUF3108 domain-containing protein [Xanthomonadales bacterium]|nr:DUF3108 domain-containing protein [Xanthomonadales bacterium]
MKLLLSITALMFLGAAHAATPPLPAFSAHYAVSKDGKRIGDANMALRRDGNDWIFTTKVKGTSGLASWLNVTLDESSRFYWQHQLPQLISYDYRLDSTLKHHQRHVRIDGEQVTVSKDNEHTAYAAVPNMVERHSAMLALAVALTSGTQTVALTVATRKRIETQRYAIQGSDKVTVPAGTFADAIHVQRSDDDHGISAWFAPQHCPVPVKLTTGDKDTMLELLSCHITPPLQHPAASG